MANLKFSQFTEKTDPANVQFIVGYDGTSNVRITPDNIAKASSVNDVGIWFQTGTTSTSGITSPRTDGWFATNPVRYTTFQANFENLVLEVGFTYKLIMERYIKGSAETIPENRSANKTTSFKRQKKGSGSFAASPYDSRPVEIEITSLSQNFDFRSDLYFSASTSGPNTAFPRPAGFTKPTDQRNTTRQFVAFRISKTNDASSVTETSQVLAKGQILGSITAINVGGDAGINWVFN
jgi:hypothetical protein